MKTLLTCTLIVFAGLTVYAQKPNTDTTRKSHRTVPIQATEIVEPIDQTIGEDRQEDSNSVLMFAEQMPEFPGGQSAMQTYLNKYLSYPVEAREEGVSGRIIVRFVVGKDGKIREAKVMNSRCASGTKGCEALKKEALRVINSMPLWKPGKQNGRLVNTYFSLPVMFQLTTEASSGPAPDDGPAFTSVEQMPEFVGGENALLDYLKNNIKYPPQALADTITGRVIVSFRVGANGDISEVKSVSSECYEGLSRVTGTHLNDCSMFEKEAVRVVKSMPKWKPGRQNGKQVAVYYKIPVRFR